ncbi:SRPBCC family protein [Cryomorphaceae bacterium]|nr:SRPBCC family protein [Cryomorphaceae bacterium]
MKIESNVVRIAKSDRELFEFFSVMENFGKLMPDDVQLFEAREDGFKFALKGMPEVKLKKESEEPNKRIELGSAGSVPFKLIGEINAVSENESDVQLFFTGNFNPMLKMMVERPLKSFIGKLEEKLATL